MINQLGWTARSRKRSGRPKLLPFKDYGGHCALRYLECCSVNLVTLVPCHNCVSELLEKFIQPVYLSVSKKTQKHFGRFPLHFQEMSKIRPGTTD